MNAEETSVKMHLHIMLIKRKEEIIKEKRLDLEVRGCLNILNVEIVTIKS